MNASEQTKPGRDASMTQEVASAMNLMVHPVAGVAAVGAIGLGLASQAFGFWMGVMAGAAESSLRQVGNEAKDAAPKAEKPAPLRLVVSKPVSSKKTVPAKPVETKAESKVAPVRPAVIEKPAVPDDLKVISGVGPKLEKVLNSLGIWTYGQIAALDASGIAWLDEQLGFAGRIGRDDWTGQAKALLAGA